MQQLQKADIKVEQSIHLITSSPEETIEIGKQFAAYLKPGDIVAFEGELGAGKTCLIKGIAEGLGIEANITSSSFVLMRPFEAGFPVYHFDLYRLSEKEELLDIGYDEFIFSDGISLIEWAEKMGNWIGENYILIKIDYDQEDLFLRHFTITGKGPKYEKTAVELKKSFIQN